MSLIHYEYKQSKLFWLILILAVVTLFEVFLISVSTGYLPTKVSFLLWDRFDYFIVYFRNEPFEALSLYFIDKPLFKIEAMQEAPITAIWGLHYYSYTLLAHLLVGIVFSCIITRSIFTKLSRRDFPVTGSSLLIFSSLFLYLSSCCSVGGNWIFHTWLLSILFNPVTATDSIIEIYTIISGGFIWLQTVTALFGIYLIAVKLHEISVNRPL